MKNSQIKLGVIGFGNMAEAIVGGILQKSVISSRQVFAIEPSKNRTNIIRKKYKINLCSDMCELLEKTNTILISVKPQQISEVMAALLPYSGKHLFMTIVSGTKCSFYEKNLGKNIRLIRIMPNMPAQIGLGATAFFLNKKATQTDKKIFIQFFTAIGKVVEVKNESLLDAVTAVSGSGPAFVYYFASALIQAAKKAGLQESVAKILSLQTLLGAAQMLIQSNEDPAILTKKITSKGGTTLAGLKVLKKKQFTKILEGCIRAAKKRAQELSKL